MKGITVTTTRRRYCGEDYRIEGLPLDCTKEQALAAVGIKDGWWVSGFHMGNGVAVFNVNYD